MPRSFGSLRSWETFVTPGGKRYKKTTKHGSACKLEDESILVSFAENDQVLTEKEYAELLNPPPAEPPAPAAPVNPPEPAIVPPAPPAPAEPPLAAPVDDAEFDAAPAAPVNPPEPVKTSKKK